MGKFWYVYVIRIKVNKERLPRLFQPIRVLYFTEFSGLLFIKPPPPFIRDLRVHFQNTYFSKHLIWMATSKVKGYETNSLMSAWTGHQKYLMWEKVLQNSFTSNVRKNTSKLTYILLKLRKCGAKHATSTDQKIARVSPSGGDMGDPPNYQKN